MAHAGLRGQVHDGIERAVAVHEDVRRRGVGEIDRVAFDAERREQRADPVVLQARVVVGVELVAADNTNAGACQSRSDVRADEARGTGH